MNAKATFALVIGTAALVLIFVPHGAQDRAVLPPPTPEQALPASNPSELETPTGEASTTSPTHSSHRNRREISAAPTTEGPTDTNKLQRLTHIRETFRALASGDQTVALRAAKQLTDETERETALLTLVTEWTQGELRPPRLRAAGIAAYGLEAGLGAEITKNPQLTLLWANELTDGPGRTALLQQLAVSTASSDPAAGLALSAQLPESDRRRFTDAVFATWAQRDTAEALQQVDQLPDPAERDAALQAIRTVAPVGIGAALSMQDGYPVINQLVPGTPAELSGQIHPGDRILALAQGDNSFVDAQGIALADIVKMVRGAPGTVLQLQVVSSDAPQNSQPRTVTITRDQIKYKR